MVRWYYEVRGNWLICLLVWNRDWVVMMKLIWAVFAAVIIILICHIPVVYAATNCCTSDYTSMGVGCSAAGTVYENITYYCVRIDSSCSSCQLTDGTDSSTCSSCCLTDSGDCSSSTNYYSAWCKLSAKSFICCCCYCRWKMIIFSFSFLVLVLIVFAISCFCCALVFLTAEQSRIKEGITFQEAYLMPIPMVTAETDIENKDIKLPPDQPTAIARMHTSIDVPIAEPTEYSPLMRFSWSCEKWQDDKSRLFKIKSCAVFLRRLYMLSC